MVPLKNLKNKKILIFGAGLSGLSTIKKLKKIYYEQIKENSLQKNHFNKCSICPPFSLIIKERLFFLNYQK